MSLEQTMIKLESKIANQEKTLHNTQGLINLLKKNGAPISSQLLAQERRQIAALEDSRRLLASVRSLPLDLGVSEQQAKKAK